MDAIFSFLPHQFLPHKLLAESMVIIVLLGLNMRGTKESIKVLLPIFVGFVVISIFLLIIYGIAATQQ